MTKKKNKKKDKEISIFVKCLMRSRNLMLVPPSVNVFVTIWGHAIRVCLGIKINFYDLLRVLDVIIVVNDSLLLKND